MFPGSTGDTLLTIILASSVMYELIGPVCAKASLYLSGSINKEGALVEAESKEEGSKDVQLDIDSIGQINNTNEEVHQMTKELAGLDGLPTIVVPLLEYRESNDNIENNEEENRN